MLICGQNTSMGGPHSLSGRFGKEKNFVPNRIGNWLVDWGLVGWLVGQSLGRWVCWLVSGLVHWLVGGWLVDWLVSVWVAWSVGG